MVNSHSLAISQYDVLCNHSTITKFYQEINMNIILLLNPETLFRFYQQCLFQPRIQSRVTQSIYPGHVP